MQQDQQLVHRTQSDARTAEVQNSRNTSAAGEFSWTSPVHSPSAQDTASLPAPVEQKGGDAGTSEDAGASGDAGAGGDAGASAVAKALRNYYICKGRSVYLTIRAACAKSGAQITLVIYATGRVCGLFLQYAQLFYARTSGLLSVDFSFNLSDMVRAAILECLDCMQVIWGSSKMIAWATICAEIDCPIYAVAMATGSKSSAASTWHVYS
eukprot:6204008-Pleurochrysis_carterae.AAC.1